MELPGSAPFQITLPAKPLYVRCCHVFNTVQTAPAFCAGEAVHGSPASVKGRAAAFEALQGAPVAPQQPGESPAAQDSALRKPPAARCGDAVPKSGQSASPAAVSSTSESPGVPAEPVEAPKQPGPQQHAAPRWALDTSGKQLLAFFDKDLLASGHAAMTTAADEGTALISSGLRGP